MNEYNVYLRTYNDRSDPDSLFGHHYGSTVFAPGVRATTASEAASKNSRTGGKCSSISGVSAVVLVQAPEVREAEHRSYEALKVALKDQGRL